MPAYCPNFSGWICKENPQTGKVNFLRTRCKQWSCEYCAQRNKDAWVGRMLYGTFALGGNWSFVTLTAHEHCRTRGLSHLNLAGAWNRMNLTAKRAAKSGKYRDTTKRQRKYKTVLEEPSKFAYVRVWELHPTSGAFHAHLLWRGRPPEWWLKDTARHAGMGYLATGSELNASPAQAVFYCAKYMTKSAEEFPKGTRRIVCSANFPDKYEPEPDWIYVGQELKDTDVYVFAWSKGLEAYDLQLKQVIARDFEHDPNYA